MDDRMTNTNKSRKDFGLFKKIETSPNFLVIRYLFDIIGVQQWMSYFYH
jgi:hypothetical protein